MDSEKADLELISCLKLNDLCGEKNRVIWKPI